MADDGRTATCCLRATDEELESDAEAFDCATCEYAARQASLNAHDHTALRCYSLLQSAVVRDLKLTPLVFDVLQLRCTQPEALLLLEKLDVIHQHAGEPDVDVTGKDDG
jgi:hypothetical protein